MSIMSQTRVHPIEVESYRRMNLRVDLSHLGPLSAAVVARVIHATADLDYATTMAIDDATVSIGVQAVRRGATIITDVEMVQAGLAGLDSVCLLNQAPAELESADGVGAPPTVTGWAGVDQPGGLTRTAAAIRRAATLYPHGAVFVVGCAPTALDELVRLHRDNRLSPALVVGTPVGFVGAAEAKAAARSSGLPVISNLGEKGGSAVASAIVNALFRLSNGMR